MLAWFASGTKKYQRLYYVPDTGIRYPMKFRHPALSGINLPDIYQIVL
jgi:hypothetical protein